MSSSTSPAPDLSTPEAVAQARAGEVLVSRDALAKLIGDPYYYQEHEREEGELDASLCFGCNAPEHELHFSDCPVPALAATLASPAILPAQFSLEPGDGVTLPAGRLLLRSMGDGAAAFEYQPDAAPAQAEAVDTGQTVGDEAQQSQAGA